MALALTALCLPLGYLIYDQACAGLKSSAF